MQDTFKEPKSDKSTIRYFPEVDINPTHTRKIYEFATGEKVRGELHRYQLEKILKLLQSLHAIIDNEAYEYSPEMTASLEAHFKRMPNGLPKEDLLDLVRQRKEMTLSYMTPEQRDEIIDTLEQLGIDTPWPEDNTDGSGNIEIADIRIPDYSLLNSEQGGVSHNLEIMRLTKLFLYAWRRDERRTMLAKDEKRQEIYREIENLPKPQLPEIPSRAQVPPEYMHLQPPVPGKDVLRSGSLPKIRQQKKKINNPGDFVISNEVQMPDAFEDLAQMERDFNDGLDISAEEYANFVASVPVIGKDLLLFYSNNGFKYVWRVRGGELVLFYRDTNDSFREVDIQEQLDMLLMAKDAVTIDEGEINLLDEYNEQISIIPFLDRPLKRQIPLLREGITKEQHNILMNFILSYAGLVVRNAERRQRHFGGELDSLVRDAWVGLLRALQHADAQPEKDSYTALGMIKRFTVYARHHMQQSMARGHFPEVSTITRPHHLSGVMAQYHSIVDAISNKNSGHVDRKLLADTLLRYGVMSVKKTPIRDNGTVALTIANKIGMPDERISLMSSELKARLLDEFERTISFSKRTGEYEDFITGDEDSLQVTPDFTKKIIQEQLHDRLVLEMAGLTAREERVLRLRFNIGDHTGNDKTLEEIGDELGITRERVRQIEAKALRKLKHPVHSRALRPFL